jgi:hypothetical protein
MVKFAFLLLLALPAFALILIMPSSSVAVDPSTLDTIKARAVLLCGADSEGGVFEKILFL